MTIAPDIPGFLDALDRFSDSFARPITFHFTTDPTYPPGTEMDPETGRPYDPNIDPTGGGAETTEDIPAIPFRPAVATQVRGRQGSNESVVTAIGRIEQGQIVLIIDTEDWDAASADPAGADKVEVFDQEYEVISDQLDGIAGYPEHRRLLLIQEL